MRIIKNNLKYIVIAFLIILPSLFDCEQFLFIRFFSLFGSIALCAVYILEPRKRIKLPAFLILMIYCVSIAIYYNFSVNSYNIRMHFAQWGFYLITLLIVSSVQWEKRKIFKTLANTVIISGLLQVIHSIDDLQSGLGRILGNTTYPNFLSMLLIAGIISSLFLIIDNYFSKRKKWGLLYAVPMIILLFAAFRTGSRNMIILLPIAIFVVLFFYRRKIAIIGLAVSVLLILLIPSHSKYRLFHEGENNPYGVQRVNIYKQVINIAIHHPFGIGYNNLQYYTLQSNFPVEGRIGRYAAHARVAHNEYLEWIVNTGIPGCLLLLSLLIYLILSVKRKGIGSHNDKFMLTLFILFCTMSFFDSPLYLAYNAIIFIVSAGIMLNNDEMVYKYIYKISSLIIITLIILASVIDIYGDSRIKVLNNKLNSNKEISNDTYSDISNELKILYGITGKPQCIESDIIISEILLERTDYVEYFQEMLNGYNTLFTKFPMDYRYYITYAQMLNKYKNTILRKNSNIDSLIISNYQKGLNYDPYRPFNRYAYAKQLMSMGDTASAVEQIRTILSYEPYFLGGLHTLCSITADSSCIMRWDSIMGNISDIKKLAKTKYEKLLLEY